VTAAEAAVALLRQALGKQRCVCDSFFFQKERPLSGRHFEYLL